MRLSTRTEQSSLNVAPCDPGTSITISGVDPGASPIFATPIRVGTGDTVTYATFFAASTANRSTIGKPGGVTT